MQGLSTGQTTARERFSIFLAFGEPDGSSTLGAGKNRNPGKVPRVVCVKFCKMAWHCGDVGVSAAQPPCLA
ncbi:hypothetical protein NKI82_31175, partial [Mesorhizobium sp. M0482]|uniref:hypothetical protein n=1 Tax=Mesorhizobium sp. M0482 TaxID=2956948 RepID=UPI00333B08E9